MKEKLEYIDAIRGFAMLLVLVHHILVIVLYSTDSVGKGSYSTFYHVHMPLFAFVSGLLYKVPITTQKLVGKIKRLLIPFMFWGVLYTFYAGLDILGFILSPYKYGYWYLLVLAYLYVFMPLIILPKSMTKRTNGILLYFIILPLVYAIINKASGYLPHDAFRVLCVTPLMQTIIPFGMGMIVTYFGVLNKVLDKKIAGVAMALTYVTLMAWVYYSRNLSIRLLGFNVGVWAWLYCFRYFQVGGRYINKTLQIIGQYSLQIYVLHYFILDQINLHFIGDYCVATGLYGLDLLSAIVLAFGVSGICVMIAKVGSRYTISRVLLEGR